MEKYPYYVDFIKFTTVILEPVMQATHWYKALVYSHATCI